MISIRHTPAEGTLLRGTAKGDGTADILRTITGWRWSRNLGCWYLQASRDRAPRQHVITQTAEKLRAAGHQVQVDIEYGYRPIAEREADRAQRIADRQDALESLAGRWAAESETRYDRYRRIADGIPLGQPVLMDHHSSRRHLRDLRRMDRHFAASVAAGRAAQEAQRAADASRASERHRLSIPATLRRIESKKAELRDVRRKLQRSTDPVFLERMRDEGARLVDEIQHWQRHVDESGEKVWGPSDFVKGDRVKMDGGGWGTVVRVNRKTIRVELDIWPGNPVAYDYSRVICRREST